MLTVCLAAEELLLFGMGYSNRVNFIVKCNNRAPGFLGLINA